MFELMVWATLAYLVRAMGVTLARTRDALHPLMILGPLLIYAYCVRTLLMFYAGALDQLFRPDQLEFAQIVHSLGLGAFVVGIMKERLPRGTEDRVLPLPEAERRALESLAYLLGIVAVVAYAFMVASLGGFVAVYSQVKARVGASSGYIADLPLLAYASVLTFCYAWRARPWTFANLALLLAFVSPNLIHGTLGSRRGPLFISLAVILFGYLANRRQRPTFTQVSAVVGLAGAAVLFVWAFRTQLYLGSEFELSDERYAEVLTADDVVYDDPFVSSAGLINVADASGTVNWGMRYLVVTVIRPIPRQLWPTKYKDLGVFQRDRRGEEASRSDIPEHQWIETLGWVPNEGYSVGMVGDLFLEFSYLGWIGCFLIGRAYSVLWRRARTQKGVWVVIYLYALGLSVYVPTQGVASAWFFRLAFASIPTYYLWRRFTRTLPIRTVARSLSEAPRA
ncbi:MAG: hypothetical protein HY791_39240 [Deltaproteobacteria bacterium]|nr:hypothetical protein [Deltaproteobacteria bacterium]